MHERLSVVKQIAKVLFQNFVDQHISIWLISPKVIWLYRKGSEFLFFLSVLKKKYMCCCIASVKHCCIYRSCKQNKQTQLKRLCWIVGSFTALSRFTGVTSFQTQMFPFETQMFPFDSLKYLNKFKYECLNETNEINKSVTSVCGADVVKCHQQFLWWSHLSIPALFSQS